MAEIERLLERSQAGDREAFEMLVRSQVERLFAAAWHTTHDPHLAEDVVQEVFLRILRGKAPYRGRGSGAAWLLRATARIALDAIRSGRAREARERSYAMDREPATPPYDPLASNEERQALRQAVERLPALTRACLWLRFGEDLTVREVAAAVGKGRSATAERIQRGVDALREEMESKGLALGVALAVGEALRALPRPRPPEDLAARILTPGGAPTGRIVSGGTIITSAMTKVVLSFLLAGGIIALTWVVVRPHPAEGPDSGSASRPALVSGPGESAPTGTLASAGRDSPSGTQPAPRPVATSKARLSSRLIVRVFEETGAPVARALLLLRHKIPDVPPSQVPERYEETDEMGSFIDEDVELGKYHVTACRYDLQFRSQEVMVEEGADTEIEFTLGPAPYIEGLAYLYNRSTPLRDAALELIGYHGPRADTVVRTDSEGVFVVGPVNTGDPHIQFRYEHFQVVTIPVDLDGPRPQKVEIVFVKGVTAFGTVTDLTGNPVPNVILSWHREHTDERVRLKTSTDLQGRYELSGLQPANYYVAVEGVGHRSRPPLEVRLTEEPLQEVPLVVDCLPTLEVLVQDASGEPIEGVDVRVDYDMKGPLGQTSGMQSRATDPDGLVRIFCVPRGIGVEVSVEDSRLGCAKASCNSSEITGPIVLRLQPFPRLGGEVVDAEDKPVAGARVEAKRCQGGVIIQAWNEVSGDAGKFVFHLPPGTYELAGLTEEHGAAVLQSLQVPSSGALEGIRLKLGTAPILRARVLGPDGSPVQGAGVCFESPAMKLSVFGGLVASTDADGRCTVVGEVDVKSYSVKATWWKRESEVIDGVSPDGTLVILHLEGEPPPPVTGIVLHDGSPVPGARVGYWHVKGPRLLWAAAITDASGRFTIEKLSVTEGAVHFYAWGPGFAFARSEPIQVPLPTEARDIEVRSLAGEDFEVQIIDQEGSPVPSAEVHFDQGGVPPTSISSTSDAAGWVRVSRLPKGPYDVFVRSADKKSYCQTKIDWQGQADRFVWTLKPGD